MEDAYVAADYCVVGCAEVVFARCHATGRVFAVCTACGSAWFDPQPRSPEPGDLGDCVIDYREYAPRGFALASRDEIRHAGFEDRVVGTRDGVAWAAEFAWFNARYYGGPQEGQSMTPTPDRSRSRRAKAARWLVGVAVGAAGELAVPAAAFVALIALLKCLR